MRASYDRETDILMLELSKKSVDHAREVGNIIIHFSRDDEPVLLEILEADEFLSEANQVVTRGTGKRFRTIRTSA